jgi:hypothetical protein
MVFIGDDLTNACKERIEWFLSVYKSASEAYYRMTVALRLKCGTRLLRWKQMLLFGASRQEAKFSRLTGSALPRTNLHGLQFGIPIIV